MLVVNQEKSIIINYMCIIEFSLGVHVCYTADILVSNNVQRSMGKKHFHRRYAATYKAICPTFTYKYARLGQLAACVAP